MYFKYWITYVNEVFSENKPKVTDFKLEHFFSTLDSDLYLRFPMILGYALLCCQVKKLLIKCETLKLISYRETFESTIEFTLPMQ